VERSHWPGAPPPSAAHVSYAPCGCGEVRWAAGDDFRLAGPGSAYPEAACGSSCLPAADASWTPETPFRDKGLAAEAVFGRSLCWNHLEADECFGRPADGRPVVFLLGDSHALQWLPAVAAAFLPRGVPVTFYGKGFGCGLFSEALIEAWFNNTRFENPAYWSADVCRGTSLDMRRKLEEFLRPGDVVALSHWSKRHVTANVTDAAFVEHVVRPQVAARNATLLLLQDGPTALEVAEAPGYDWSRTTRRQAEAWIAQAEGSFPGLAARSEGVLYFNRTLDLLCGPEACDGLVPGTEYPAYFDGNHFSQAGALFLGNFLRCFLEEAYFSRR